MTLPGSVAARLPTAFSDALRAVVAAAPGARAAVFLDLEGEAIDQFVARGTVDVRLVGAHLGVIVSLARDRAAAFGRTEEVVVEAARGTLVALAVDERYLVALEAAPDAPLGLLRRELYRTRAALRELM